MEGLAEAMGGDLAEIKREAVRFLDTGGIFTARRTRELKVLSRARLKVSMQKRFEAGAGKLCGMCSLSTVFTRCSS